MSLHLCEPGFRYHILLQCTTLYATHIDELVGAVRPQHDPFTSARAALTPEDSLSVLSHALIVLSSQYEKHLHSVLHAPTDTCQQ